MATITFRVWNAGVLSDATSVVLSDKDSIYGIKRNDTDAVVVTANTAMIKTSTGVYAYTFTPPAGLVTYTAWIKVNYSGAISYYEVLYTSPADNAAKSMPSEILWNYLTATAKLFTDPVDNGSWPLYINGIPDGNDVSNVLAGIFDTVGVCDGKNMRSVIDQHYGIQFRFRAMSDDVSYEKASVVESALSNVKQADVYLDSGEHYRIHNLSQTSPIVKIGVDEKMRSHYTVNYLVCLQEL